MSVNSMSFEQVAPLLNELREQVTGVKAPAPVNSGEFTSVATTVLKAGYEPVINAITQMITRTIFSIRPYNRRFAGIQADSQKWGSITRKLQIADKPFEDDARMELVDGQPIDMYEVNKPIILMTSFYGQVVYEKSLTIFKDQLDSAFTGPDEFGRFMAMVTQNASDMIEQAHESLARMTIGNFITGKIAADNGVVHLITEYNAATGESVTPTTVLSNDNFPHFIRWMYARVATLTTLMTERSAEYQIQIPDKEIMRHTPLDRQKVYMRAPFLDQINARVLADAYHDDFLRYSDVEKVNYWQGITAPDEIKYQPTYMDTDGSLVEADAPVEANNVVGVIFDDEALGYSVVNQWSSTTPLNSRGGYWNTFFHFTDKYWNDFTEKGIILQLD